MSPRFAPGIFSVLSLHVIIGAAENGKLVPGFREIAQPFIEKSCLECHGV